MLTTQQKEALGPFFKIANSVRLELLKIKYRGNKVRCTCCQKTYSQFAPFGVVKRQNAWCPNCQSLERDRLLWMYLENKTNLYELPLKLLHVAPEIIFFNRFSKAPNLEYHPVDIFPHLCPPGTKYMDILNNDVADNSYDVIICNHVFQYIEPDRKAMQELFRIMKPGGWAIMQVPIDKSRKVTYEDPTITDPIEREKAFGLKEHVRYYALDYADRLAEQGFLVKVDNYTDHFTDEEIFRYGFYKDDPIFFCRKPG